MISLAFAAAVAVTISAPALGGACTGDCDSSGAVSASELVRAVRLSLGDGEEGVCAAADANGDEAVSIDELVAAVASSFNDCGILPLPSATSTPSGTPTPAPTSTPSPRATPTDTPVLVDGLWHEDDTRLIASDCIALVEEVRLQLFPLNECEFALVQEGEHATIHKECRPEGDYDASVDANGVVRGTIAIREAQQGCVINLEVQFSYAMGTSPTPGDYTLLWDFSSSCRPLLSCEQTLRTTLTRVATAADQSAASKRTTIEREKSGSSMTPFSTAAACQRSRQGS